MWYCVSALRAVYVRQCPCPCAEMLEDMGGRVLLSQKPTCGFWVRNSIEQETALLSTWSCVGIKFSPFFKTTELSALLGKCNQCN